MHSYQNENKLQNVEEWLRKNGEECKSLSAEFIFANEFNHLIINELKVAMGNFVMAKTINKAKTRQKNTVI